MKHTDDTTVATTVTNTATPLPTASLRDTLGAVIDVLGPNVAKGPIIRRRAVVGLAERFGLDRRSVRRMQRLRERYGPGPLMLRVPGPPRALVLEPAHVRRVLEGSPEPFATDTDLKRAALSHFEPDVALVSRGRERAERRRVSEEVLDSDRPMHRLAERFARVVREEAEGLLAMACPPGGAGGRAGELDWPLFEDAWFRIVRRIVFGDGARDDEELRDIVDRLRAGGNWAFLRPKRRELRERFHARLHEHLARAEPGSLASVMAATPFGEDAAPEGQVPQWLFAFDPAGMTTFRTLALLASHPEHAERARAEIREEGASPAPRLPFLRACVLESLRLWPTTPLVLRQSTERTEWGAGAMPANTAVMIVAPFFHRDDRTTPHADRFAPEPWLEGGPPAGWIPFSAGPAICPGRHLVLLATSLMTAEILKGRRVRLEPPPRLDPHRPLPGTLDPYRLRFRLEG